jgi:hypothetical protein
MSTTELVPTRLHMTECAVCKVALPTSDSPKACPQCRAMPQERAFAGLLRGMLREYDPSSTSASLVIQAHVLSAVEQKVAATMGKSHAPTLKAWHELPGRMPAIVSLEGIATGSVDLFYSAPGILDFVPDMEAALRSTARVLRPSGVAVVGLNALRLQDGTAAPAKAYRLPTAPYGLAPSAELWSMTVSRRWLLETLQTAGLAPFLAHVSDPASGGVGEYVLGQAAG